jgi:hypothetical protein
LVRLRTGWSSNRGLIPCEGKSFYVFYKTSTKASGPMRLPLSSRSILPGTNQLIRATERLISIHCRGYE